MTILSMTSYLNEQCFLTLNIIRYLNLNGSLSQNQNMLLRLRFNVIRSLVTGDWWRFCPFWSRTHSIKLNQYLDILIYRLFYDLKQQQYILFWKWFHQFLSGNSFDFASHPSEVWSNVGSDGQLLFFRMTNRPLIWVVQPVLIILNIQWW